MGVLSFFGRLGDSFFGFILKMFLMLLALVFVIALIVILIVYWPFTLALLVGLLLSPVIYRRLNRQFGLHLPKWFYHNFQDLMVTFHHGEEEVTRKQLELNDKIIKAREQLQNMLNATNSLEEQLNQVKTKKSLKTLFTKSVSEINPRAAKALELELGKPVWSQYLDKVDQNGNGDWEKFKSVPDTELENSSS